MKKILYTLLGVWLAVAGTAFAVQVSVPSGNGAGFLLQSLTSGNYGTVSLTAGSNITLSTTTSNITISSSGGGNSFSWPFDVSANYVSTSTTIGFLNGLFSTASSTFSSNLFLSSLSQGGLYTGTNGLVGTFATTTATCSGSTSCSSFTIIGSSPVTISSSGGASGSGTVGTSTNETQGNLSYWTTTSGTPATLGKVATSSLGVTAPITFSGTIGSQVGGANGSFGCTNASSGVTGCLTGTDWTTFNTKLGSYDAWTHSTIFLPNSATTSKIAIGTTTPYYSFTVASSTGPQFALSDGTSGIVQWTMRNAGGSLYFSTTTAAGTATSTQYALSINANNNVNVNSLSLNSGSAVSSFTGTGLSISSGALGLTSNTISGVALGGTLGALSHDTSLTGTSYTGTAAVSDWGLALNHTNTWSVLQNFNYSSSTLYSSFVTASTTNLFAGLFTLSTSTAGCLNTNSAGIVSSLTCGSGTVTSVGLSSTNSTLSIGSTPVTVSGTITADLNLAHANTWTALQQFNANASSTMFSANQAAFGSSATTTITTGGFLGIGSSTPFGSLSINAASQTADYFTIGSSTSSIFRIIPQSGVIGGVWSFGSTSPSARFVIHALYQDTYNANLFIVASSSATATSSVFQITNTGAIYAPNTLTQSGAATDYWCYDANGQFIRVSNTCTVSALKFKKDITPLTQGLDTVLAMKPVNYYLNNLGLGGSMESDKTRQQIGFIADYSATTTPLLILHDNTGAIHGFNYEQFTAILTKAIQDFYGQFQKLIARVSGLEAKVNNQQKEIDNLQAQIDALKK